MMFFLTKSELIREDSPQIKISESTKSGRERMIFSHESHKNNKSQKYYVKSKMIWDYIN